MAFRVPKVSLHVESAGEGALGEARGEAVGLGLMLLLTLDMMLGGMQGTGLMPGSMRYAFCVASACTLLLGAAADKRLHALFRTYRPVALAMVLFVPGAVCGITGGYFDASVSEVVQSLGGAFNGMSMAVLVFLWGISFGRLESRDIALNTALGVVGGVGSYVLLRAFVPESPWLHALISALQLAHLALLRTRVTDRLPDPDMRGNAYFAELNVKRGAFALTVLPATFCMGLILGNIVMHAGVIMKPDTAAGVLLCVVLTAVGGAVVLAACGVARSRDQSFGRAFRSTVPVIAILMPPLGVSLSQAVSLDNMLLLVNFTVVASMAWAYMASLAQGFRLSPVFVFGLGQGGIALGYVLAAPVNALLAGTVAHQLPAGVLALVVSLVALALASSMLPRREDILAIVVRSFKPAEMREAESADAAAADGAGAGTAGAAGGASWGGADAGQRREAGAFPKSHAGTPYERTGEGAATGTGESEEVRKGRFVRRCERVADTYLLSRRETDVLFLLAKGRNVGFITQQLCISEGTAKTHVNHVYKKCGVHSRQELICLIDSFDAE